jgi:hypothetical protein
LLSDEQLKKLEQYVEVTSPERRNSGKKESMSLEELGFLLFQETLAS